VGLTPIGDATFQSWQSIYLHTGQVAVGILLFFTVAIAWRIRSKVNHNPNSEVRLLQTANLFLLLSFLTSGIAFWFSYVIKEYFWYVLF